MPSDVQVTDLPEEEPWQQLPAEPLKWYHRFLIFRDMGTTRTLLGAYKLELSQQTPPRTVKQVSGSWVTLSRRWSWKERALAWDVERRKHIFNRGHASELVRIEKLDRIAELLYDKVVAMLERMSPSRGGFNADLLLRFLETEDALARETGGRVQKREVAGPGGSPVQVLLYLPEQESSSDEGDGPFGDALVVLPEDVSEDDG